MAYHKIGGSFHSLRDAKEFAVLYRELARDKNLWKIDDHIFIKPVRSFPFSIWEIYISDVLKEFADAHFNR